MIRSKTFLNTLETDKFYVVTFEFIPSMNMYDNDGPILLLGKPIIITKNSNPITISKYIKERMNIMIDAYYLNDEILSNDRSILVNYAKINLF